MCENSGQCRLCGGSDASISIFNTFLADSTLTLSAQAMSCAHIQIQPGDGLPDRICENCSFQLSAGYRFKLQCEDSDRSFRSSIVNMVSKSKPVSEDIPITFKLENLSDSEDDKEKLHKLLNEDSVRSYTPLIDASDNVSSDSPFSIVKRSDSGESKSEFGTNFKSESSNTNSSRFSKKNGFSKSNINSVVKKENEDFLNLNTDVYSRICLKLSPKDKMWMSVDCCNHEELITDDKESSDEKSSVLCHLCGMKYKLSANHQRHLPSFKSRKRRNMWHRNLKRLETILRKKKVGDTAKESQDTSQKKYMCDVCGQTYRLRSVLLQHQNTHMDVKLHSCNICGKRFTRSSHVVAHMRIHDNVKPYVCESCGKSFTKSSDLCRHKRVHSDVRNYACSVCGRRFKRSGDITSHMRSHTGDRPYSCIKCNKSYSSHSSLQKHRKTHSKTKIKLSLDNNDDAKAKIGLSVECVLSTG